jgi:drug/metabolite transporter (DMT)-like permease
LAPDRQNLRGILAMCAASALLTGNDALVKLASAGLPTGEIIFVRGAIGSAIAGVVVSRMGLWPRLGRLVHWRVGARTAAEIGMTIAYLGALFRLPIGIVTTLIQAAPLAVAAASAAFLGERVGWRRWTAIGIGFIGVVIVLRPGLAGFDPYMLLALLSVALITVRDLVTRGMPRHIPVPLIAAVMLAGVGLAGAVLGLGEEWVRPSAAELATLAAAAALLTGGQVMVVLAIRGSDLSVVAPFRYTIVIYAMILGFLIWGDIPDGFTVAGVAVIVGTGLYMFHRERQLGRRNASLAASPE